MTRVLLVIAAFLAVPAVAVGAVFTTVPYDGKTLPAEAGPFGWSFVSSLPSADKLGGVAYELSSDHVVVRCLEWGSATLFQAQPGETYTITITDDYSPRWLAERGLSTTGGLCAGSMPAGGNTLTDSITIAGTPGIPIPANEGTPFTDPGPSWIAESDGKAAERQVAEALAARKAKEEQEHPAPLAAPAAPEQCVVPALAGHSLAGARRLLAMAHCGLGHITVPSKRHGKLVIAWQHPGRGAHLLPGTRVSVKLATVRRR